MNDLDNDWSINNNKNQNKRNISTSSSTSMNSPTLPKNKKPKKPLFITANRFEVLSQNDDEVFAATPQETISNEVIQEELIKPPSPIFLRGVLEFKDLCNEISKLIGKDKFFCKSSTDQLKIQTATPEAYRLLVHYLKNNNAQYHTYQLTQDKPIRVVIRNIHPSTDINEIKKELTELSFVVIQVTNVLHKTTKLPLPLFFVDLEKSEKSLEIFKLPSLLYTKIKVEEPYKLKTISQCQNCQDYGHTRSYCGYPPRCVRCGNSHLTSNYTKPRDSPAKCALCLGNHPANYRGCNVFKELQRRNKPNNKSKFLHDIVNLNHSNNNNFNVKENHPLPTNNKPNTHSHPKTYAQATSNETTNTCHSNHSSPTLDINKTMSDFFENFKSLINPLIALLTQFNDYFSTINSNFIIGGDINAKHQSWGCRATNPRGNVLYNFTNAKKYSVLAPPGPTYWPSSIRKKPDIPDIFVSKMPNGSLWKETNKLLRYKASLPPLTKNDTTIAVTNEDKAEVFRQHLSEIFKAHPDIFNPILNAEITQYLDSPMPLYLPEKSFTPNKIKSTIQKYSLKKSPGFDLITAEVARCLPKKAILFLTHLFNSIFRLSYFPLLWKFSNIILIPKPDKPLDLPSSYRPISLLPFLAKVLERLILKRLLPYIVTNKILPNSQFGFRSMHSTIHQVHRLVDAISFSLEKKYYCTCAFLDISQAFDRVWYEGLLFKLKKFLSPSLYLLLKSYLTNRHFQIRFGSSVSEIENIFAGVPQGGILSPLLFNIYTSDQPVSQNTIVADYADDKAIISIDKNPQIASSNLQIHLNLMSEWYIKWRIKPNPCKSVHTTFTLCHSLCPNVSLQNVPIPTSNTVRYLGLNLDKRLTWNAHIRIKRLALNARLRRLGPLLSNSKQSKLKVKVLMYKTLLKPMWTYGLQLWDTAKVSNTNKIQQFQNVAFRKITNAPPFVSNYTLHKDLAMKTVKEEAVDFYKRFHNRL
ncbi:hypothetical protein QTP88_013837 [Uroleucon formosanum]